MAEFTKIRQLMNKIWHHYSIEIFLHRLLGNRFKKRNIPIDGIGIQRHHTIDEFPGKEATAADVKVFTDQGLSVYLTEVDVAITGPVTEEF